MRFTGLLVIRRILGYVFHYAAFTPGGAHGYFVSEWLNAVIGKLGTGIVLITCLFAILSFTFDTFIARCRDFVKELIHPKVSDPELPIAIEAGTQTAESAETAENERDDNPNNSDSTDTETQDDGEEDDGDMPFEKNDKDLLKFEITTTATFDNSDDGNDLSNNLGEVESQLIDNDNDDSADSNDYSHYVTGNYSLFIKVMAHDNEHLRRILSDKLQRLDIVERTETIISLEESFRRQFPIESND